MEKGGVSPVAGCTPAGLLEAEWSDRSEQAEQFEPELGQFG